MVENMGKEIKVEVKCDECSTYRRANMIVDWAHEIILRAVCHNPICYNTNDDLIKYPEDLNKNGDCKYFDKKCEDTKRTI